MDSKSPVSASSSAPPPPIAVQLYSLREQSKSNFAEVLERVGAMGYVGVEVAGFHGMSSEAFSAALSNAGLQVASGHIGDLTSDPFTAALDELQAVGCNTVVGAFLPPTAFADLDAIKRSADLLNAANARASARRIKFGYHNHWWEFETMIDGRSAWSHLIPLLDSDVFVELDLYWATVGGADPIAVVGDLGDRLRILHVKDGPADDPKKAMVAVGSGSVDICGVLEAAGPKLQWHVVELDRCDTDMYEAVAGSYRFLTSNNLSTGRH
jgi:sugar phosphate isomerase/epimerase